MNKNNQLIPEFRFPEFVNEGEWEEKLLEKHITERNEISNGEYSLFSLTIENGVTPKTERYERAFLVKDEKDAYKLAYPNDFAFNPMNLRFGAISQYKGGVIVALSKYYNIFYCDESVDSIFCELYFKSRQMIMMYNDIATGSLIEKRRVHFSAFLKLEIPFPTFPEQQKIASTLSSLDDLIAAHSEKLSLLQTHKKGLMQNLFPQAGETVPKLRFPEFEGEGEWVEKTLGEVGEPLMCKRILKEQTVPAPKNNIPFYKIGTFGKEADAFIPIELFENFKNKYSFPKKGDILISAAGTIGRLVVFDGLPAYFQDSNIVWLGNDESEVINSFLFYYYSTIKWQTSDGGIIRRLYNSDLKGMKILFSKNQNEQKKIATCLSSLDALITAQSERIVQLKAHKKGLMQGLFPKIKD